MTDTHSMLTQLNPPIPVHIVDKGNAVAPHLVIDYGLEHDLIWVVFLDANGESWAVKNPDVRARWNETAGRVPSEDAE